ncbi:MAG: fused MFS/spermidine synthase [bacterium]
MAVPYRRTLFFLFWASGLSGLTYEVIWTRMLTLIFGNTVYATATVLSVFMAGLALGSFYFGRFIDHRRDVLKIYAYLELGLGVYALLLPSILPQFTPLYTWIYREFGASYFSLSVVRFVLSFLALLIPTTLMGATLPVLSRYFIRSRGAVGRDVGLLYGLNTFGAVVGCFGAGFIFIFAIGVHKTAYMAAAINLLVGIATWVIQRRTAETELEQRRAEAKSKKKGKTVRSRKVLRLVLVGFGLSGLTALAYEVFWMRSLIAAMITDTYAFSAMLTTMLLGIALGSLIYSKFLDRPDNLLLKFGLLEIGIGLSAVILMWFLPKLGPLDVKIWDWAGAKATWSLGVGLYFLDTFTIMLIPALLMGMTFPLVSRIYTTNIERRGTSIGRIYAVNTLGAIFGSIVAGFVLIPTVGVIKGIIIMSFINLFVGSMIILSATQLTHATKRTLVVSFGALLLFVAVLLPKDIVARVFAQRRPGFQLIHIREGVTTTVTIYQHLQNLEKEIGANGYCVAGTNYMLRTTQKIQGHFPLLFHPDPQTVLTVGFGSGETAWTISQHGVKEIHAAEISPEVIEVSSKYFTETNHHITNNPILTVIIMDGKNYVLMTDKTYDVIMNDSIHPGLSGNGSLYTKEYFETCKAHLNPGGIMSSWIPLFQMSELDFRVLLKTFREVFPFTSVWFGNNCLNRHALLVGSPDPDFKIDFKLLEERMVDPAIQSSLKYIHIENAYDVLDCFVMGPQTVASYVGDAPLNTDDNAYLEFSTPRCPDSKYIWWQKIALFKEKRESVYPYLTNVGVSPEAQAQVQTTLQKYFDSTGFLLQGIMDKLKNNDSQAVSNYRKALLLNPDHRGIKRLIGNIVDFGLVPKPKTALEYLNNARLSYYKCDYEDSIELIKKALAIDSTLATAHFALGLNYQDLGLTDQACEAYKTSLTLDPELKLAKERLQQLSSGEK